MTCVYEQLLNTTTLLVGPTRENIFIIGSNELAQMAE